MTGKMNQVKEIQGLSKKETRRHVRKKRGEMEREKKNVES